MKKLFMLFFMGCMLTSCQHQSYDICDIETCNNSAYKTSKRYIVRKPVEVIYEDTIYTTVYKPVTYVEKRKVTRPYCK